MNEYTIDAENQSIGRVATQAARILMGKDTPSAQNNEVRQVTVHITNTSKARISNKKKTTKQYMSYSGYPSGQNVQTLAKLIEKKGHGEAFRRAVYGMLPANRLRAQRMKNLTIHE